MIRKISGRMPSLRKSVGVGAVLGFLWTLLCALVIAKMVDTELLSMENVGYGTMTAVLTGAFVGASVAGSQAGHMVIQASVLSGAAYFLCLLLVNWLFFRGGYTGMGVTMLLIILATALAVLVAGKGSGKPKRRQYKMPRR